MEDKKAWYSSKTLWLNFIGFMALGVQSFTGFVIAPEQQGAILTLLNLVLRIITKKPLEW